MHQVCAELLEKNGLKLAVAESCTGGLIASRLISVPGSSGWLVEGAVTYSPEAKMRRLGVKAETLNRYTVVSAETAMEMAEGIRLTSGADMRLMRRLAWWGSTRAMSSSESLLASQMAAMACGIRVTARRKLPGSIKWDRVVDPRPQDPS